MPVSQGVGRDYEIPTATILTYFFATSTVISGFTCNITDALN